MKITFKNLGKIKEASLNLGDFTLIVGDNSLGKTILLESYALYMNVMKDRLEDFVKFKYIYDLEIELPEEMLESFLETNLDTPLDVPLKYKQKTEKQLMSELKKYEKLYLKLLKENILGSKESDVEIEIKRKFLNYNNIPKKAKLYNIKGNMVLEYKLSDEIFKFAVPNFLIKKLNLKETLAVRLEKMLNEHYFRNLCSLEDILFFPSERNLYQINAKRKSADFIENSFTQIMKETDMRYSESLFIKSYFKYLDYLDFLEEDTFDDDKAELYQMLCKALGGKPIYEEGIVTKIKSEHAGEINKKLFSTKQNRLLPYFMLCTNILDDCDCIVIEEPEAHMSLKSMFELVEVIEWILRNKKLILTSHSDIFVSLLNNLIKQKQINARVYELLSENGYSVLKEVPKGDYGYELSFMSEQITRLNNEMLDAYKDVIQEEDRRKKEEGEF